MYWTRSLNKNVTFQIYCDYARSIHDRNLVARYSDTLVMLKDGKVYARGDPKTLLTEENIRTIFGVEAVVINNLDRPYVAPVRPLNGDGHGI